MKKILTIIVSLSLMGCAASNNKFTYPVNHNDIYKTETRIKDKKIIVLPFNDLRNSENKRRFALAFIPLVPYGSSVFNRPGSANMFLSTGSYDFDAAEDLAKATAYSLNKSGLISNSYFSYGENKEQADYILEGNINTFQYKGKMYTYGLSFLGVYLWFFGLPTGNSENIVDINFKLVDVKSNNVIWENNYSDQTKITQGIYYNSGDDVKNFAVMYQNIMNNVIKDLSGSVLVN